jgi:aminopeptidase
MDILKKYAHLLIDYCLEIKSGEKLYIKTSMLAEPLVREVYREAIKAGAHVEIDFSFREKGRIFLEEAAEHQLKHISEFNKLAIEEFDAYLVIRAPYNLKETKNVDPEKRKIVSLANQPVSETYFRRTGNKEMKRSLCQFPTLASAQEADMSLEEYQEFVFNACHLYADDPKAEWLKIRASQQKIVDFLNTKDKIRYKNKKTDIEFSVKNRIWINSDGQSNMPSGEVFTGPIEDSVNGTVFFNYPAIFMGNEVSNITLEVENGKVIKWHAERGQGIIDKVMEMDGAQFFGEVAIGTNYNIQQATKNILFDEKIGGTIHMAVGQSYSQTGGKNKSAIHWDMITDMKDGGEIYADGEKVYENGEFIIF